MSSPISSALEKLDGSLLALQSEVDCLRAGLEVNDDQLRQSLTEAHQRATMVRDLIRAERADAGWSDRKALDLLILELTAAARDKRNEERRTRLLELASEFEAGSIKHRFESRVSALNALRQEAIEQLRADAALPEQEKVLPGPGASEWLHWACSLQEDSDASTLEGLRKDFSAIEHFTSEMEESYWVPGTRAAVTPVPPPEPAVQAAKAPAPDKPPVVAAKEPARVEPAVQKAKEPAPVQPAVQKAQEPVRVEPAVRPAKEPAPEPAPVRGKGAVAATVATFLNKPQQPATAQVQQTIATPIPSERTSSETRPASEPVRASQAATWQAAAVAPAKEPDAPTAAAAPRMKYCDKCGSTYPPQFNVCPIDTAVLRFTTDPAPSTTASDTSSVLDKVDGRGAAAATAVTAAQASSTPRSKKERRPEASVPRDAEPAAVGASPESSEAAFAELRASFRDRPEDEPLVVEEHEGTDDWQALLREKNWRALAANPVVLAVATLVLVLVLGLILWRAHRSHVANDSVKAMEKAPEQPAANTQPTGIVTNSAAQPLTTSPSTQNPAKPQDQSAAAKAAQAAQQKPATQPDNPPKQADVLSLPMPAPKEIATAKKPEAANEPIEAPALPNAGGANNLGSIAKDVPLAVPTLTPQKLRVSSGVAQAQLTRQVRPQYPPEALQSRVHGTVVLQAVIGKDGEVKNLKVVSGPPMLIKSATEAVKQWRYKPFTLNGDPVEADTQINVNFTLGEQ